MKAGRGAVFPLLALLPAAVLASPGRVEAPGGGAAVVAGEVVLVRWRPLPLEVEEMELFLSLDGGQTYPLRLTPQLPPGLVGLFWTVPNLPTPAARLRLRVGLPGRGEVDGEPSEVFSILAPAPVRAEPVARRGGELWVGRGTDGGPPAPPGLGDTGEEARAGWAFSSPGEAPKGRSTPLRALARRAPPSTSGEQGRGAAVPPRSAETTPLPLRR